MYSLANNDFEIMQIMGKERNSSTFLVFHEEIIS